MPNEQTSYSTNPSLLDVLRERRSRRFACGMRIEGGALEYTSQKPAVALTEHEEAMLCFAGCGITGRALADLSYKDGDGGDIMAGLIGRTIASGDGIQSVALVVSNDDATFLLRWPWRRWSPIANSIAGFQETLETPCFIDRNPLFTTSQNLYKPV